MKVKCNDATDLMGNVPRSVIGWENLDYILIQSGVKQKQYQFGFLLKRFFPRFLPAAYMCFVFWLAHWIWSTVWICVLIGSLHCLPVLWLKREVSKETVVLCWWRIKTRKILNKKREKFTIVIRNKLSRLTFRFNCLSIVQRSNKAGNVIFPTFLAVVMWLLYANLPNVYSSV